MRTQYLHVSAYSCEKCGGPVISGSTAVRENEISRETDVRNVRSDLPVVRPQTEQGNGPGGTRDFPPVQWDSPSTIEPEHLVSAYFEEGNRKELY
jgi:hypothetical protein